MNKTLINGLLFSVLTGASQVSFGALAGADTVTIEFPRTIMTAASYGDGVNETPDVGGFCPPSSGSACYYEDGFVIGVPTDENGTNHIHRTDSITGGGFNDKSLAYHADSAGIYLRALDGSAFDLMSMIFHAPIAEGNWIMGPDLNNPIGSSNPNDIGLLGPQEKWEIFGFTDSVNPNITSTDGYGVASAYASIANGFDGTVGTDGSSGILLDEAFKNVAAVWIHYNGYPSTPLDGIEFDLKVDNIVLGAPAQVPVPAAAWLFGSGLLGLLSFGRKKAMLSA